MVTDRIDPDELVRRENERTEWKEHVADIDDVVATLTAFANDLQNLGVRQQPHKRPPAGVAAPTEGLDPDPPKKGQGPVTQHAMPPCSASHVILADPPVSVVVELHLVSTMRGLSPDTLLMLDFGIDDESTVFPLTVRQARQLHSALDKLLATAGA